MLLSSKFTAGMVTSYEHEHAGIAAGVEAMRIYALFEEQVISPVSSGKRKREAELAESNAIIGIAVAEGVSAFSCVMARISDSWLTLYAFNAAYRIWERSKFRLDEDVRNRMCSAACSTALRLLDASRERQSFLKTVKGIFTRGKD